MEFLILFLVCLALIYAGAGYVGRRHSENKELAARGIDPFNYRQALRVRDRTRRGPTVEPHLGKTQIGRRG